MVPQDHHVVHNVGATATGTFNAVPAPPAPGTDNDGLGTAMESRQDDLMEIDDASLPPTEAQRVARGENERVPIGVEVTDSNKTTVTGVPPPSSGVKASAAPRGLVNVSESARDKRCSCEIPCRPRKALFEAGLITTATGGVPAEFNHKCKTLENTAKRVRNVRRVVPATIALSIYVVCLCVCTCARAWYGTVLYFGS